MTIKPFRESGKNSMPLEIAVEAVLTCPVSSSITEGMKKTKKSGKPQSAGFENGTRKR